MSADEPKFDKQQNVPRPLLESFSLLFYVCKFMGVNSQDLKEFKKYRKLTRSPGGESYVIIQLVLVFINFNLMIGVFESSTYLQEKDNFTLVIGFELTYLSLVTYLADRITGLIKQQSFVDIFHDLEEIDEEFMDLSIVLNNNYIKNRTCIIILLAAIMEATIFISTLMFLVEQSNWTAWLWAFTAVPTFLNTLDKVWYIGILFAIKSRFEALNNLIDKMALKLDLEREEENNLKYSKLKKKKLKKNSFKNKIQPVILNEDRIFGDVITNPQLLSTSCNSTCQTSTSYTNLEERFIKLCQLHDGLCNVAKLLNDVWAFPNFILMGYGFFIITAHLYFHYCSYAEQAIPSLFRPAQNLFITAVLLLYVSIKCVSILFVNWKTNLESKKTGICIHRCALAADKDDIYEMINHFSLKLFNHLLDFNACGYFPLNMTTLFGFCGGITTYLIILIQFNIEGQLAVKSNNANKTMALQINETQESVVGNMINQTIYGNSTSLLNMFQSLSIYFNKF